MDFDDELLGTYACPFCAPEHLDTLLAVTEHFRIIADHAPLVEGHTLIIPREHYPCYGAVPLEYEPELIAVKRRVARFFRSRYRPAVFFEHGVFRQTVFHAHLHAFPFGPVNLRLFEMAHPDGQPVHSLADLHAWYEQHGHYFYLEQPRTSPGPLEAAVFPPEEERYFRVLRTLRENSNVTGGWRPPHERRLYGASQMAALEQAWHDFERDSADDAAS